MDWKPVGKKRFHTWQDEGDELEGVWQGSHDGRFGPVGELDNDDGGVEFPLHTVLQGQLVDIDPGTEIRIKYLGKRRSKAGRTYKAFMVFTR